MNIDLRLEQTQNAYRLNQHRAAARGRKQGVAISLLAIAMSVASFGLLLPTSRGADSNARVFTQGVNIQLDRNSPAFAALEDAWTLTQTASVPPSSGEAALAIPLVAGSDEAKFLAAKIMRANQRERALLTQERVYRLARDKAVSDAAAESLHKLLLRFQPKVEQQAVAPIAATETSRKARSLALPTQAEISDHAVQPAVTTKSISLHVSREELLASLFLPIANSNSGQDASQMSPDQGADTLPSTVTVISPATPGHPRVIRAPIIPTHPADPLPQFDSKSDDRGLASRDLKHDSPIISDPTERFGNSKEKEEAFDGTTSAFTASGSANFQGRKATQGAQPKIHQIVVAGPLELSDGMALANALDRVVVYREVDGEPVEHGAVWLRDGKYEIFVEENTGYLIGELRTPYGDVIGRGVIDLSSVPVPPALLNTQAAQQSQRRIEGIDLKIKPVPQGVVGRVLTSKSDGSQKGVAAAEVIFRDLPIVAKTTKDGRYEDSRLLEGSNAIVQINRPGSWGTLAFAHSGTENQIEVFPNQDDQMMKKFFAMARTTDAETLSASLPSAIIWGKVTKNGQVVAGAKVDLLTTADVMQPIYFNSAMVPDPTLTATSANGLYAFFPVPQGTHAVQATLGNGVVTEPVIFPAESRTVSHMNIELASVRQAKVKVFDAFHTSTPLTAEISSPGSQQIISVDETGSGTVHYANSNGLLILDASPGVGYEHVRVAMSRDRRTIFMPMIRTEWLEAKRGALRLNAVPGTGTMVGFVQGSSAYRVTLDQKSAASSAKVIYFNASGETLESEFGEPGGGFIIFDAPEGFRTVMIQPSGSMRVNSSVSLVDGKVVSVISHWIR